MNPYRQIEDIAATIGIVLVAVSALGLIICAFVPWHASSKQVFILIIILVGLTNVLLGELHGKLKTCWHNKKIEWDRLTK